MENERKRAFIHWLPVPDPRWIIVLIMPEYGLEFLSGLGQLMLLMREAQICPFSPRTV